MLQLQWNNAVEDIIDIEVINSLRKYKNIVIFGAGESGGWVVHLLRHFNIEPKCYCDNYSDKWGKEKREFFLVQLGSIFWNLNGKNVGLLIEKNLMQFKCKFDLFEEI